MVPSWSRSFLEAPVLPACPTSVGGARCSSIEKDPPRPLEARPAGGLWCPSLPLRRGAQGPPRGARSAAGPTGALEPPLLSWQEGPPPARNPAALRSLGQLARWALGRPGAITAAPRSHVPVPPREQGTQHREGGSPWPPMLSAQARRLCRGRGQSSEMQPQRSAPPRPGLPLPPVLC